MIRVNASPHHRIIDVQKKNRCVMRFREFYRNYLVSGDANAVNSRYILCCKRMEDPLVAPSPRLLSPIFCLSYLVSCLPSLVSRLVPLVAPLTRLLSLVSCLLSLVSCPPSLVSCLSSPVSSPCRPSPRLSSSIPGHPSSVFHF